MRLTQTEYNIVAFLSEHAGRVMTYAAIVRAIWGDTDASSTKKLQVNMANIRKKLGSRPGSNAYILNELGVGYRMIDEDARWNLRRRQRMTLALILFVLFYILMLAVQQYRPWVALGGAGRSCCWARLGVYDFTLADAARAVDFNVLLMMAGMMGTVFLFIQSKMPARLAEELIAHVPDVRWAVSVLALLAGFISAFVDNVATVLMVAPVGLPSPGG